MKINSLVLKRLVVILALSGSFAFASDLSGIGSLVDQMNDGIGDAIGQHKAEEESKVQVTINVPYDLDAIPEGYATKSNPDKPFTSYFMSCWLQQSLENGGDRFARKDIEITNLQGTLTFKWSDIPYQTLLKLSEYKCSINLKGPNAGIFAVESSEIKYGIEAGKHNVTGRLE